MTALLMLLLWNPDFRHMVQYKRTDLHTEKQGIFTGSLNNLSILAFKIKDHHLTHCTSIITCTGSAHVCLLYCIISLVVCMLVIHW